MANQGFSRIFSWCETPPGSTKEVECACVPIHNASKLQGLPIDPDLEITCVDGDVLIFNGTEWVCDGPINLTGVTGPTGPTGPTGSVGQGVDVSFEASGPTGPIFTSVTNNSKQYDKIVILQFNCTVGPQTLLADMQNLVGVIDITKRPAVASQSIAVYIATLDPHFGFEAAVSTTDGKVFIKPGVQVEDGTIVEFGCAYTSI